MSKSKFEKQAKITFCILTHLPSGFGGLEVACRPLVHKFAGSNPAEAVGFFRAFSGKIHRPFLAQVVPPFTTRVSGGDTWRCK